MRSLRAFAAAALAALATPSPAAQQQQQRTIAPTDTLVVDGEPPIPASLADEVRRYTESRPATFADWHPGAREMLVSTRFGNTAQIHHVKTSHGARTQMTFYDKPVRAAAFEPTEGRYFLFGKDVGGNEFRQLYRYDVGDGKITLLTDGGRSQNGGVRWSTKGDRIAYGSTGADRDVYIRDPATPKSDRLVLQVSGGGWGVADWSPDDTRLLVIEFLSITKTNIHLLDVATGQRTPLTDPAESVACHSAAFSADGKGVYVATDKDSELQRLGSIDIATKQYTSLTTDLKWG